MKLIDSHCHLDDEKIYNNRCEIVAKLKQEQIAFIAIGYDVNSSKKEIEIARQFCTYVAIGISPNDTANTKEEIISQINEIEKLLLENKDIVVAIGEIGLDYYWNKENKELQKYCFEEQIKLANKYNLPITIHSRDAYIDTIKVLKDHEVKNKGIFHCCQQNIELIKEALNLGYYISFAGPITYKSSKSAKEIVNMIPKDKILVETDSPYLSPEPKRGTTNVPNNVTYVAKKIALFYQEDEDKIFNQLVENTKKAYKIEEFYGNYWN